VREVESEDGVLTIDDTVEEKPYTDESDLVCWHYDHSQGRSVKGINIVNVLYETGGIRIPVGYETVEKSVQVWDKKKAKWQKKSAVSKNEQVRGMLNMCSRNAVKFRYVLADAWYAAAETMDMIHSELEKHFIMPVKSNRKVALSAEDKQQGNYQAVSSLALEASTLTQVYVEQLTFPVLLAKQVFTNEDGNEGVLYLLTDDLTLDYAAVTTLYQKRWGVETFHKSLKSNASLAKSPAKTKRTQKNHIFLSFYAFVKLERLSVRRSINHFALRSQVYLKALQASFDELRRIRLEAAA
jgi:IS4 transposase